MTPIAALALAGIALLGFIVGAAVMPWRIASADRRRAAHQRAGYRQSVGARGDVQSTGVHATQVIAIGGRVCGE